MQIWEQFLQRKEEEAKSKERAEFFTSVTPENLEAKRDDILRHIIYAIKGYFKEKKRIGITGPLLFNAYPKVVDRDPNMHHPPDGLKKYRITSDFA